ncbi:hypothetical protein RAS1_05040 [Phycisphaerae bacterium RAS1]|nr:hypothetical protein RAS1_05040 [Phycisphaerae bacterium RAS1]
MGKNWLKLVEIHIEKAVIGVSGLFLLAMIVMFLVLSPNKVEFGGRELSPGELDEAIKTEAEELDRRVKNAKVEDQPAPTFASELKQRFESGIQAAPLRLAGAFGTPLPTFTEQEEAPGSIAVVTPLKPLPPAALTGRSMGVRVPRKIGQPPGEPVSAGEPAELPWVSLAAYFPVREQQDEMTRAGYAAYRARVYVVGVDVQRQELLASGEYSPWSDVTGSRAMPEFDVPGPIFDDETGAIINKSEIDAAWEAAKSAQVDLMQPAFFQVRAGDTWHMPPLPGFDEDEFASAAGGRQPSPAPPGEPGAPPPVPGAAGGPPAGGGGLGGPPPSPAADREAKEKVKTDLAAAQEALKTKQWDAAVRNAELVLTSAAATQSQKTLAGRVRDNANKEIAKTRTPIAPPPSATPTETTRTLVTAPGDPDKPVLLFHDDTVESGKTYRYRMRVRLWNRYLGRLKVVKEPAQARKSVLIGEWSLAGAPITVTPSTYFFVKSPRVGKPGAIVDVFKWRSGDWIRQNFEIEVGDQVGALRKVKFGDANEDIDFATGAIVLDVRDEPVAARVLASAKGEFRHNRANSVVVSYLDPADGQVKEKALATDKDDPRYRQLKSASEK